MLSYLKVYYSARASWCTVTVTVAQIGLYRATGGANLKFWKEERTRRNCRVFFVWAGAVYRTAGRVVCPVLVL